MKIDYDGLEYKIELLDKHNDINMGKIIYKELKIELDSSMQKQLQKSVLFHECTHLILANLGEFDLNSNEGFVERLSNSFFKLIKDNKKILFDD